MEAVQRGRKHISFKEHFRSFKQRKRNISIASTMFSANGISRYLLRSPLECKGRLSKVESMCIADPESRRTRTLGGKRAAFVGLSMLDSSWSYTYKVGNQFGIPEASLQTARLCVDRRLPLGFIQPWPQHLARSLSAWAGIRLDDLLHRRNRAERHRLSAFGTRPGTGSDRRAQSNCKKLDGCVWVGFGEFAKVSSPTARTTPIIQELVTRKGKSHSWQNMLVKLCCPWK